MAEDDRQLAAVYVGFSTFKTAVEQLAVLLPNRIDRSAFPGFAGGVQSQLLTGMRFLGLINGDGKPTQAMHALAVKDEEARKSALAALLRERYANLFSLDLTKATPQELAEEMARSYAVGGDTKERAIRFFLSAVSYVGIPISPLLARVKGPSGPGGPRKRRPQPRGSRLIDSTPEPPPPTPPSTEGESVSITLKSGGTLTLAASARFFELERGDRNFVFELLDKLKEYERNAGDDSLPAPEK